MKYLKLILLTVALFFMFNAIVFSQGNYRILRTDRIYFEHKDVGAAKPDTGNYIYTTGTYPNDSLWFTYRLSATTVGYFLIYPPDTTAGFADSTRAAYISDTSKTAGTAGAADSLINQFQYVWKRNATGSAWVVHPSDSLIVGDSTHNPFLGGKIQIWLRQNNPVYGISFVGDSGATGKTDLPFIAGRMNNNATWELKHYAANDHLQFTRRVGGATAPYWDLNPTGIGINQQAVDLFNVAGNMTVGTASVAAAYASGLIRVTGIINTGSGGGVSTVNDANTFLKNDDNVFIGSGDAKDTANYGRTVATIAPRLALTDATPTTSYSFTINTNLSYHFSAKVLINPTGVDSGYFSKEFSVTARLTGGAIVFDTTTMYVHSRTATMGNCDFYVTTSGSSLRFTVVGDATQNTHAFVSIWREFGR